MSEPPSNHLGSIWYHSEPLEVPYSPNQLLGCDFFCRFLQEIGSRYLVRIRNCRIFFSNDRRVTFRTEIFDSNENDWSRGEPMRQLFDNLMSWLEYNSAVILNFFMFWIWKLLKCPKNWIKSSSINLFELKRLLHIFILEIILNSDSKWKQGKVKDYSWVALKSTY